VQLQVALPLAGSVDAASHDLRPRAVRLAGGRMLALFGALLGRGRESTVSIVAALQHAWAPHDAAVRDAVRAALILCADHELNVSAFAARCAASAGASPYDVVSAALATLKGFKHGGAAERVSALVRDAITPGSARTLIATRLRRGEGVPGFGHPLYPEGDPRATALLQLAEARRTTNGKASGDSWRPFGHLAKAGADLLQDRPNVDFALAAIAHAYRLPPHAPLVLFAVGRTLGWIAHAIEEYESGRLIRPRAQYVGPSPMIASNPAVSR
jgi:citrate synthase